MNYGVIGVEGGKTFGFNLTQKILEAAFKVHTSLGVGLLETVYDECLFYELSKNHKVKRQVPVRIEYESLSIENAFKADLLVDDLCVVELKTVEQFHPMHEAQLINYMHLMKMPLGLLLNFKTKSLKYGIKRYYFEQYTK